MNSSYLSEIVSSKLKEFVFELSDGRKEFEKIYAKLAVENPDELQRIYNLVQSQKENEKYLRDFHSIDNANHSTAH